MTNFWGYIILSIIFLGSSYFSYQQKEKRNEILKSGNILNAVIVKMPESCIESNRQKNYCEIVGENKVQYKLQLNYSDCSNLNTGDRIQVRQKVGTGDILRYNAQATTSNYIFELILLSLATLSLAVGIYNFKKQRQQ